MQIKSSLQNYEVFASTQDSFLISLYCTVGSTPSLKYIWFRFLKGNVAICSHSSGISCSAWDMCVCVCVAVLSELRL